MCIYVFMNGFFNVYRRMAAMLHGNKVLERVGVAGVCYCLLLRLFAASLHATSLCQLYSAEAVQCFNMACGVWYRVFTGA